MSLPGTPAVCVCGHSVLSHWEHPQPNGHPRWLCGETPAEGQEACKCDTCSDEGATRCACRTFRERPVVAEAST